MAINSATSAPITPSQTGEPADATAAAQPGDSPTAQEADGYESAASPSWTDNLRAANRTSIGAVADVMYEADVHYAMTLFLAKSQGFTEASARAIADGTELPDQDHRSPVPLGKQYAKLWLVRGQLNMSIPGHRELYDALTSEMQEISLLMEKSHFHRQPGNAAVEEANEAVTAMVREAMALSPREFGEALHAYQDSFSHSGRPSLAKFGLYGGHPGNFTSHACDQTWKDPEKMMRAAEWTYGLLEDYWAARPELRDPNASPKAFSQIESVLRKFASAGTVEEKIDIMRKDMGLELDGGTLKMLRNDMTLPKEPRRPPVEPRFQRYGEN